MSSLFARYTMSHYLLAIVSSLLALTSVCKCHPVNLFGGRDHHAIENDEDYDYELNNDLLEEGIRRQDPVDDEQRTGPPLSVKDLAYGVLYVKGQEDVPAFKEDPTLQAGLFEGDIVGVIAADFDGRNAIVSKSLRWPDGKIPYIISDEFGEKERAVIAEAMEHIHKHTCIKFIPRDGERDYIALQKGDGCSSSVGRKGGKQDVSLGNGCIYKGIVVHELTHSIGFWHEQSRPDRDDYIIIEWKNIKEGMVHNFRKYDQGEVSTLDLDYDINSIMHYGPYSFSKTPNAPSIRIRNPRDGDNMGQRDAYSPIDIKKVNRLYNCHAQRRWSF